MNWMEGGLDVQNFYGHQRSFGQRYEVHLKQRKSTEKEEKYTFPVPLPCRNPF